MGKIPASGIGPEAISPKGGVMIMRAYEVMYIIRPNVEEEQCNAIIEKFNAIIQANGGEVVKTENMGKKKLAYEIDKVREGNYVLVTFNGPSELPAELERNMKIADEVMRYMVTKLPE